VVLVNNETNRFQFFVQAVAADSFLENALDDRRAFRAFKKLMLFIYRHRADEIPVCRMQRKDEIRKKLCKPKKKYKNMSLLSQKLFTPFHKKKESDKLIRHNALAIIVASRGERRRQ
jgi:hypothetical protein